MNCGRRCCAREVGQAHLGESHQLRAREELTRLRVRSRVEHDWISCASPATACCTLVCASDLSQRKYDDSEGQCVPGRTEDDCANVLRRRSRHDFNAKIETWIAARTFSPNAALISMGSSQERAELEAKLARCRDLAREFREGPTADMIRDLETEICESLQRLADAADLADPADDLENGSLPHDGMGERRLR